MSLPVQPSAERLEILDAFADLPDVRQASDKRHQMTLCLALFTLAVTAGNRGFLAIGDWLTSYRQDLLELFQPPQQPVTARSKRSSFRTRCRFNAVPPVIPSTSITTDLVYFTTGLINTTSASDSLLSKSVKTCYGFCSYCVSARS